MRTILILLSVVLMTAPLVMAAQFNDLSNNVSLEINPRFPNPNTTVTVTVNDFALGAGSGIIRWQIDGEEKTNLANARSITVPVGAIGEPTKVTATLTQSSGQTINVSKTIVPSTLALIIEPQTTAPTWYLGRPLPSVGSVVRVIALPNTGTKTPATNYTYTWQLNNQVLGGGPIFGQNVNTITMPYGSGATLTVTAADNSGQAVAQHSVRISNFEPEMYFYVINPLQGQKRLAQPESFFLLGEEMTLRAEPYNLARTVVANNSVFEWKVNGRTVNNPSTDPYTITLRNDGGTGQFEVAFHVRNLEQLLQGAKGAVTVAF